MRYFLTGISHVNLCYYELRVMVHNTWRVDLSEDRFLRRKTKRMTRSDMFLFICKIEEKYCMNKEKMKSSLILYFILVYTSTYKGVAARLVVIVINNSNRRSYGKSRPSHFQRKDIFAN